MWLLALAALGQTPPAPANVAATVDGEVIRLDEVDALIRRRPVVDGPLTAPQVRELRTAVVHDLIDDRLLAKFLKQHGPQIDPAEVEKRFRAMAEGLRRQGRTVAEFAREVGRTEDQLREAWADAARFQRYVEERATEAELRKYHAAYKDFFDRVAVKVGVIVLRVPASAPPGDRTAAREKLSVIRADVLAGKLSFEDAARKHSVDPTAPLGGEVGFIARKDTLVDDAICRAAFALPVGGISEPVETEFGVQLVRVTARKPGTPSAFEQIADEVRDCYAEDVRQSLVGQLRKAVQVQVTVP